VSVSRRWDDLRVPRGVSLCEFKWERLIRIIAHVQVQVFHHVSLPFESLIFSSFIRLLVSRTRCNAREAILPACSDGINGSYAVMTATRARMLSGCKALGDDAAAFADRLAEADDQRGKRDPQAAMANRSNSSRQLRSILAWAGTI